MERQSAVHQNRHEKISQRTNYVAAFKDAIWQKKTHLLTAALRDRGFYKSVDLFSLQLLPFRIRNRNRN